MIMITSQMGRQGKNVEGSQGCKITSKRRKYNPVISRLKKWYVLSKCAHFPIAR
jgi:hypothetical protein